MLNEITYIWLVTITFLASLTLGYYTYLAIKKRFDSVYNAKSLLPKRIIHSIVYIIFLILIGEAVRVRVRGPISSDLIIVSYLLLSFIGVFIFLDIIISVLKIVRGRE